MERSLYDEVEVERCVICGIPLNENEEYICSYCSDQDFKQGIERLWKEINYWVDENQYFDSSEPVYRFTRAINDIAIGHKFFICVNKLLEKLTNAALKGNLNLVYDSLLSELTNNEKTRIRLIDALNLLEKMQLISETDNGKFVHIPQDSVLYKVGKNIGRESSQDVKRTGSFMNGYFLLGCVHRTLQLIENNDFQPGKGITGLYPVKGKQKLMFPKQFSAPFGFTLFIWSKSGKDKLKGAKENFLRKYLADRGFYNKEDKNEVKRLLTGGGAWNPVGLFNVSSSSKGVNLSLRPEFIRLRDRIRARTRERERERERGL